MKRTAAKARRKIPTQPPPTRYEFETFRSLGHWERERLIKTEPSCFNSHVSIYKWLVKFERIEEPIEVLAERLRKLWRECDNPHHYGSLMSVAAELGVTLDSKELGKDAERR